jgi:hypothetical protein
LDFEAEVLQGKGEMIIEILKDIASSLARAEIPYMITSG